jgi:hypothetical protein
MSDQSWLRDALRSAAASPGPSAGGARAAGALRLAAQRRRQRLVAASCTAVVAVFLATGLTGGAGSTGLRPAVLPTGSPSAGETYERTASPTPEATPEETATPATPEPSRETTAPPSSAPAVYRTFPPPPGPLDVFFVVDTTGDMQPMGDVVPRIVGDIVARLDARVPRNNVGYGFARFGDFTAAELNKPVYERLQPIRVEPGQRLPALTYAGGGDDPEATTIALDGVLGRAHAPYSAQPTAPSFRPNAAKLVVLVTSAPMKQGDGYPPIEDVVRDLRAAGIRVVALHAMTENRPEVKEAARADLDLVGTGTEGVVDRATDCDGDGRIDLRRGDALVCGFHEAAEETFTGFADALLRFAMSSDMS